MPGHWSRVTHRTVLPPGEEPCAGGPGRLSAVQDRVTAASRGLGRFTVRRVHSGPRGPVRGCRDRGPGRGRRGGVLATVAPEACCFIAAFWGRAQGTPGAWNLPTLGPFPGRRWLLVGMPHSSSRYFFSLICFSKNLQPASSLLENICQELNLAPQRAIFSSPNGGHGVPMSLPGGTCFGRLAVQGAALSLEARQACAVRGAGEGEKLTAARRHFWDPPAWGLDLIQRRTPSGTWCLSPSCAFP